MEDSESLNTSQEYVRVKPETSTVLLSDIKNKLQSRDSLVQKGSFRLNNNGRVAGREIYKELKEKGIEDGDVKVAGKEIREEIKIGMKLLRKEVVSRLRVEGEESKGKDFREKVNRLLEENESVREAKITRKLLSSVEQKIKAEQQREKREEIRGRIKDEDLVALRQELLGQGKKVGSGRKFLENIYIAKELKEERGRLGQKEEVKVEGIQREQVEVGEDKMVQEEKQVESVVRREGREEVIRGEDVVELIRTRARLQGEALGRRSEGRLAGLGFGRNIDGYKVRDVILRALKKPALAFSIMAAVGSMTFAAWNNSSSSGIEQGQSSGYAQAFEGMEGQSESGMGFGQSFEDSLSNNSRGGFENSSVEGTSINPSVASSEIEMMQSIRKEIAALPNSINQGLTLEDKIQQASNSEVKDEVKNMGEQQSKESKFVEVLKEATSEHPEVKGVKKLKVATVEEVKRLVLEKKFYFKNNHPVVIEEAEFLKFLMSQPEELRSRLMDSYAGAIIDSLVKTYGGDSKLILALEVGHMSVAPKGKSTQDTGTAAFGTAEKVMNYALGKKVAEIALKDHPGWTVVLNTDKDGFPVDQVATFQGSEFNIRCLDVEILQRVTWEKLAAAKDQEQKMVRIALHFNGAEGDPRGGMVIPQAAGEYKQESEKLSKQLAESFMSFVQKVMPGYKAVVAYLDDEIDPYPITDAVEDDQDKIFSGKLAEVKGKGNRYLTRIILDANKKTSYLVIGSTKNS